MAAPVQPLSHPALDQNGPGAAAWVCRAGLLSGAGGRRHRGAAGRGAAAERHTRSHSAGGPLRRCGRGPSYQIRGHLASIGHRVVGDTLYGGAAIIEGQPPLGRYFLHAHRIRFHQPSTGEEVTVVSPLAPELEQWMDGLSSTL